MTGVILPVTIKVGLVWDEMKSTESAGECTQRKKRAPGVCVRV